MIDVKKDLLLTLGQEADSVKSVNIGANNRSYSCLIGEKNVFVKYFLKSNSDLREKISAEWNFLRYLEDLGEKDVPIPIAVNYEKNFIVLSYFEGLQATLSKNRIQLLEGSADFINRINRSRYGSSSLELPLASEHTSSIRDYVRLNNLKLVELENAIQGEALVVRQLLQKTRNLSNSLDSQFSDFSEISDLKLLKEQLCLSPSDFGFHNMLIKSDCSTKFIDFEYAGWDDPAKLLCEFVLHPAMKLDLYEARVFIDRIDIEGIDPSWLRSRCQNLFGYALIRWVCIILNLFLPAHLERKLFANPSLNIVESKSKQVEKAEIMVSNFERNPF